jgi:hypothetical protein
MQGKALSFSIFLGVGVSSHFLRTYLPTETWSHNNSGTNASPSFQSMSVASHKSKLLFRHLDTAQLGKNNRIFGILTLEVCRLDDRDSHGHQQRSRKKKVLFCVAFIII